MDFYKQNKGTASVWAGETERFPKGAVTSPIVNSVAFAYHDLDEWYGSAMCFTPDSKRIPVMPLPANRWLVLAGS